MEELVEKKGMLDVDVPVIREEDVPHTFAPRQYPQVIKYMGSKAAILNFIGSGLAAVQTSKKPLLDLFAGACAISGGFGHRTKIISNDIQQYSAILASTYLKRAEKIGGFDIVELAGKIAKQNIEALPLGLHYSSEMSLAAFDAVEKRNRELLYREFDTTHHLFTRAYAGTWWSAEQCVWIDAIREVLDILYSRGKIETADFSFGLTCLLHAMAYTSQGTGHYAQYRDAKDAASMLDINKYRRASVPAIFKRKFSPLLKWHLENVVDHGHELVAMDYRDCLSAAPKSVIYADPPYAFVHYSRFYHAMETIVKYDYPEIQLQRGNVVKGRYRADRHQSPFCIKTKVRSAFCEMFEGVKDSKSDLLLSYSNTGMIGIENLIDLASDTFGSKYKVWVEIIGHSHKTMGRRADHSRAVEESLVIAKRI